MAIRTIKYANQTLEISYIKQNPRGSVLDSSVVDSGAGVLDSSALDSSAGAGALDSGAPNKQARNIVFLHGWGSNKEIMQRAFAPYFKDFTHYYIDLPGFGQSPYGEEFGAESKMLDSSLDSSAGFGANDTGAESSAPNTQNTPKIFDTSDYARIIDLFFHSLGVKADIIAGHSFGGKVAMLCQSQSQNQNNEVMLLSSAGIVRQKSLKVRAKIALSKLPKQLGVRIPFLRAKDAQGLKRVVNEDFSSIFAESKKRASIFWGRDDDATPLDSGERIHALMKGSRFFVYEGDHYFFLHQGDKIERDFMQNATQNTMQSATQSTAQNAGKAN